MENDKPEFIGENIKMFRKKKKKRMMPLPTIWCSALERVF